MVSVVSKLNAAAYRLNADRVINAGRRLSLLLKANFNPSQPRVPAGSADGGRWTDESDGWRWTHYTRWRSEYST